MATSPIYSWPEPDNTDLVKNGALAIRTMGDAIDTTMATMVAKTIIDAKGDLIAGTAADTAARLAVGTNNALLTAASGEATGLKYAGLWTTFTPTIAGITLGNGSKAGTYCQIADTVFFRVILTFGSTTSFSGGAIDLTLPTTPSGYSTFDFMNVVSQVYDTSATAFYPSVANINIGGTAVRACTTNTAGTYAVLADYASVQPITFATGDVITWQGSYRTA
jgi:hypothetical protein